MKIFKDTMYALVDKEVKIFSFTKFCVECKGL